MPGLPKGSPGGAQSWVSRVPLWPLSGPITPSASRAHTSGHPRATLPLATTVPRQGHSWTPVSWSRLAARALSSLPVASPVAGCWVDTVVWAELRAPSWGWSQACTRRGGLCVLGEGSELPLGAELGMWVLAEGCPAVWSIGCHCSGGISLSSYPHHMRQQHSGIPAPLALPTPRPQTPALFLLGFSRLSAHCLGPSHLLSGALPDHILK